MFLYALHNFLILLCDVFDYRKKLYFTYIYLSSHTSFISAIYRFIYYFNYDVFYLKFFHIQAKKIKSG